ncbi:MAG TPA: SDR family oxidoreductase [Solirubrobacteraceae bacterium]
MTRVGERVLVTGASRGLGQALAVAFAREGAAVLGTGRDAAGLRRTAELCKGHAGEFMSALLDVTMPDRVRELVAEYDDLSVCVVNAGVAEVRPFAQTELEDLERLWQVDVAGAFVTMQAAAASMTRRRTGRIVVIASDAGYQGIARMAGYVAAKHALLGLCRTLALELEGTGVGLTVVCPGPIRTELLGDLAPGEGMDPDDVAALVVAAAATTSTLAFVELRLHGDARA